MRGGHMKDLDRRIRRLEAATASGGACPLCAAREARAAELPPRRDDLTYQEIDRVSFPCPRCSAPVEFVIVEASRREAA